MFAPDQYQLLDFGNGRKLEQFASLTLNRPCPAAESSSPSKRGIWSNASARYDRTTGEQGAWTPQANSIPSSWQILHDNIRLELRGTPFGHVGVFPEQAQNWEWIAARCRESSHSLNVLNLFAYTGAATLTTVAAGARVTHVDASHSAVQWARHNAQLSKLSSAPVRWIIEDVLRFTGREIRREHQYDAVILDPPSYGHGPKSEVWKIEEDLPELLRACAVLTGPKPEFVLLSCHSPRHNIKRLRTIVSEAWPAFSADRAEGGAMIISTPEGRQLHSGICLRCRR